MDKGKGDKKDTKSYVDREVRNWIRYRQSEIWREERERQRGMGHKKQKVKGRDNSWEREKGEKEGERE